MACACSGRRSAAVNPVTGYVYTPPGGGEPQTFLTSVEAKVVQRRNGGGTITVKKRDS